MKRAVLATTRSVGLFSVVRDSAWRRERLLILGYHGISIADEHEWNPALYTTRDFFASRLKLLKRFGCTILPLDEALRRLYEHDLPERSVAITFDDGNHDFYVHGRPLLEEFGFPATLYLTTFYSEYNRPVFDVIVSYLLWKGRNATLDLEPITGTAVRYDLSRTKARAHALLDIRGFAERGKSAEEKDALAATLAERLRVDYDALLDKRILHLMTPEETREVAASGIDIQLHTHRHRMPLDRDLFRREIEDNRRSIEAMTGVRATHFCYPSGIHDPSFLPWVRELGIVSATTCDVGITTRDCDPLLLPRLVDTSTLSEVEFEGWLTGVSNVIPRRFNEESRYKAAFHGAIGRAVERRRLRSDDPTESGQASARSRS